MTFENDAANELPDLDNPALKPTLRWMANIMRLCGLCERAACRRAQACRGDPRACVLRYAPLVPEEVRDAAKAMFEGQERRLSFDELRDETPEIEDLIEWTGIVNASMARATGA
jgi:hypothetical protein